MCVAWLCHYSGEKKVTIWSVKLPAKRREMAIKRRKMTKNKKIALQSSPSSLSRVSHDNRSKKKTQDRGTDRRKDRQTNRPTDGRTNRPTDGPTDEHNLSERCVIASKNRGSWISAAATTTTTTTEMLPQTITCRTTDQLQLSTSMSSRINRNL